jgi:NTP pyrophosphatase (non-canonical NTP hydrolase)
MTMTRLQEALQFRETFGQPIVGKLDASTDELLKLWEMQMDLIEEECGEFFDAADVCLTETENERKRENVLKELSDLVFVCYQFAACFGLDLDQAMARVFESNLSKLDEQGQPIYREDGKVLKGPNYCPPDLLSLVK